MNNNKPNYFENFLKQNTNSLLQFYDASGNTKNCISSKNGYDLNDNFHFKLLNAFLLQETGKRLSSKLLFPRILESLAGCRSMLLFAVVCKIGVLERNAY